MPAISHLLRAKELEGRARAVARAASLAACSAFPMSVTAGSDRAALGTPPRQQPRHRHGQNKRSKAGRGQHFSVSAFSAISTSRRIASARDGTSYPPRCTPRAGSPPTRSSANWISRLIASARLGTRGRLPRQRSIASSRSSFIAIEMRLRFMRRRLHSRKSRRKHVIKIILRLSLVSSISVYAYLDVSIGLLCDIHRRWARHRTDPCTAWLRGHPVGGAILLLSIMGVFWTPAASGGV